MKKRILFALLLPCLFVTKLVTAQLNAVNEMKLIRDYYTGTELKHLTGQMLLINKQSKKQLDKVEFEYWIKDKQVYSKMNYIEILNNSSIYVMINHRNKSIYARPLDQMESKPAQVIFDAGQLNKLLAAKGTQATLSVTGSVKKLTISGLNVSRFSNIEISYDADYRIRSINATMNDEDEIYGEPMELQINYSKTEKTISSTLPGVLSVSRYLEIKGNGQFEFAKNYQGYQKL